MRKDFVIKLKDLISEKALRAFDFDNTLVKTDSHVRIEHPDGSVEKMTPSEFIRFQPKGGEKFDYSDFDKLINPISIKKYHKMFLDFIKQGGSSKVIILTARASEIPVKKFLDMIGVGNQVEVVAVGDKRPKAKKRYISYMIQHGYDDIFFIDDKKENIKAIESLRREYPDVNIKTRLATI